MTKVDEALAQMEGMLANPVADLNRRLAERCVCRCSLETGAIVSMCKEHEYLLSVAREAEREWCARVVELHECWVRDHSRAVFAERIAKQIRERRPPDERELKFAREMKLPIPGEA